VGIDQRQWPRETPKASGKPYFDSKNKHLINQGVKPFKKSVNRISRISAGYQDKIDQISIKFSDRLQQNIKKLSAGSGCT